MILAVSTQVLNNTNLKDQHSVLHRNYHRQDQRTSSAKAAPSSRLQLRSTTKRVGSVRTNAQG